MNLLGSLPGDQVWPSLALGSGGGVLAWEDNVNGGIVSIGAARLDANFNVQQIFTVPKTAVNDKLKPKVQLLRNGNTVFVFESPVAGTPDIYARFSKGANFYTPLDVRVNTYITDQQVDPDVAALPDGGAVIVWSSFGQDGNLWGVFARKFTAAGVGATAKEFQVNQYTLYNQKSPAVTALANGNYVIAWVSEQERFVQSTYSPGSVDIYARIFTSAGVPVTGEFLVNSTTNVCANPSLAPLGTGGFVVAWSQKDSVVYTNGWDVWARAFKPSGMPEGNQFRMNTYLYGDQYRPKLAAGPSGVLAVWTSMGQDGDHEGVFGRYLAGGTQVSGPEFQVNTTTINRQMHPAVAWNGVDRFFVVWTSFSGLSGFDLFGQMYLLNP